MAVERRIFVSMTFDSNLSESENQVKWAIVKSIAENGFEPICFFPYVPAEMRDFIRTLSPWTADRVEDALRSCVGAALIGQPRWEIRGHEPQALASEYTHYEAGVVRTLRLPTLVVASDRVTWRGGFETGTQHVCTLASDADVSWLESAIFTSPFSSWLDQLRYRRDVFIGYSTQSRGTASNLKRFLEDRGATVLDWVEFSPGSNILEQIETACSRCTGGVFLFTRDDEFAEGDEHSAAPRDNVVLEAGYFIHAKGNKRVLIVRQNGTKMPADLGGAIYASLADLADIEPIQSDVNRFLDSL